MAEMPEDAIAEVRRAYAARGAPMDDLTDEQVGSLMVTHWTNLDLRLRELGRLFGEEVKSAAEFLRRSVRRTPKNRA